jgi:hypothetical protein
MSLEDFEPSHAAPLAPPRARPRDSELAVSLFAVAKTPLFFAENLCFLLWGLLCHLFPNLPPLDRRPRQVWSLFTRWYDAQLDAFVCHVVRLRAYVRATYFTAPEYRHLSEVALRRERNALLRPYLRFLGLILGLILGRLLWGALAATPPCTRCIETLARLPNGALVDGVMCAPHPANGSPLCLEGASVRFRPDPTVLVEHVADHCDTVVHEKRATSITFALSDGRLVEFTNTVAFQLQMFLDIRAGKWPC